MGLRDCRKIKIVEAQGLKKRRNWVFAKGEYTHPLRLASELADLRVAYANQFPNRERLEKQVRNNSFPRQKKKHSTSSDVLCFLPNTDKIKAKTCIFNEIVLRTMKSEQARMKSSACGFR